MKNKLENKQLEVITDSFGAEMHSIRHDGIEYLWQADPEFWARHAPILFPIVGKLTNDEYYYDSKSYKMEGHGFARDSEFKLISTSTDEIIYELTDSANSLEKYPFHFNLKITYKLVENRITVNYAVRNTDKKTIYFGIGAHPAFNVPLEQGSFEDYYLSIDPTEKRAHIPIDPATGTLKLSEAEDVSDYKKKLTHELFSSDALVYTSSDKMTVSLENNLDDRSVSVSWEKMPFFGLWSPYPKKAPFVCIEPWCGVADIQTIDADLTIKFGINTLEPDQVFECSYVIEVS